jgi:hypothetical protein
VKVFNIFTHQEILLASNWKEGDWVTRRMCGEQEYIQVLMEQPKVKSLLRRPRRRWIFNFNIYLQYDAGSSQLPCSLKRVLRWLASWDCRFESRRRNECLSVLSVICLSVNEELPRGGPGLLWPSSHLKSKGWKGVVWINLAQDWKSGSFLWTHEAAESVQASHDGLCSMEWFRGLITLQTKIARSTWLFKMQMEMLTLPAFQMLQQSFFVFEMLGARWYHRKRRWRENWLQGSVEKTDRRS